MIIRYRYETRGHHVHVDVFIAWSANQTFAKSGVLVFNQNEWLAFQDSARRNEEFVPK